MGISSLEMHRVRSSGIAGGVVHDIGAGALFIMTNGHVCASYLKEHAVALPMVLTKTSKVMMVISSDEDKASSVLSKDEAWRMCHHKLMQESGGFCERRRDAAIKAKAAWRDERDKNNAYGRVYYSHYGVEDGQWRDVGIVGSVPSGKS